MNKSTNTGLRLLISTGVFFLLLSCQRAPLEPVPSLPIELKIEYIIKNSPPPEYLLHWTASNCSNVESYLIVISGEYTGKTEYKQKETSLLIPHSLETRSFIIYGLDWNNSIIDQSNELTITGGIIPH